MWFKGLTTYPLQIYIITTYPSLQVCCIYIHIISSCIPADVYSAPTNRVHRESRRRNPGTCQTRIPPFLRADSLQKRGYHSKQAKWQVQIGRNSTQIQMATNSVICSVFNTKSRHRDCRYCCIYTQILGYSQSRRPQWCNRAAKGNSNSTDDSSESTRIESATLTISNRHRGLVFA